MNKDVGQHLVQSKIQPTFIESFLNLGTKNVRFLQIASLTHFFLTTLTIILTASPAWCQDLDLSSEIIENSPVLQRWRRQIPNVWQDIKNDPSFRTRWRLGYFWFADAGESGGFNVGVEDVFLGRSPLTVSGGYQGTFDGAIASYGTDLRYYLRPLGSYVNIAPVVGYRYLGTKEYSRDGINLGLRLLLVPSRGGAADISLTQSFVSPGSDAEVGITVLSLGYAITRNLRLSTDIVKQNAREHKDTRLAVVLEWML